MKVITHRFTHEGKRYVRVTINASEIPVGITDCMMCAWRQPDMSCTTTMLPKGVPTCIPAGDERITGVRAHFEWEPPDMKLLLKKLKAWLLEETA